MIVLRRLGFVLIILVVGTGIILLQLGTMPGSAQAKQQNITSEHFFDIGVVSNWCDHVFGSGSTAQLEGAQTVYEIKCEPGTHSVSMTQAGQMAFGADAIDVYTDFSVGTSWRWYSGSSQLGGVNLNQECQDKLSDSNAFSQRGNTVQDWTCNSMGKTYPLDIADFTNGCMNQYGIATFARVADNNNPDSVQCWRK